MSYTTHSNKLPQRMTALKTANDAQAELNAAKSALRSLKSARELRALAEAHKDAIPEELAKVMFSADKLDLSHPIDDARIRTARAVCGIMQNVANQFVKDANTFLSMDDSALESSIEEVEELFNKYAQFFPLKK